MGSQAVAALRAEMAAQVETIRPLLEGTRDYVRVADDGQEEADMREAASQRAADRQRRLDRIAAVVAQLDALEGDGYPDLPKLKVPSSLFAKFQRNKDTLVAAFGDIEAIPDVAGGTVTFAPVDEQ